MSLDTLEAKTDEMSAIFAALSYLEQQAREVELTDTARFLRLAMADLGPRLYADEARKRVQVR